MRRWMIGALLVAGIALAGAQGSCGQQVDLTPIQNQISNLEKQVQDLSSKVQNFQVVDEEGEKKVVASADTKGLEDQISKLDKKVTDLNKKVESLSVEVERLKKAVQSLAR